MDLTNPTRPRSVAHEDMSLRRGVLSRTVPQRLGKRPTNHRSRPFTVSIVRYHHCTSRFQSPFCFFSFVPDTIVVIPLYLLHCSVTLLFYCSPSAIVLTVDINPSTCYLERNLPLPEEEWILCDRHCLCRRRTLLWTQQVPRH